MVFRDSPRHLENTFWVAYFLYYIYTFLCFFFWNLPWDVHGAEKLLSDRPAWEMEKKQKKT